jgi:hypothetical protein
MTGAIHVMEAEANATTNDELHEPSHQTPEEEVEGGKEVAVAYEALSRVTNDVYPLVETVIINGSPGSKKTEFEARKAYIVQVEYDRMKASSQQVSPVAACFQQLFNHANNTSNKRRIVLLANSKKHDVLPSWCNPQDDYCGVGTTGQSNSQIAITTRRKKTSVWSFLTSCLVVIGGMTYWHLQTSLHLMLRETETVMAGRNQLNIKLRYAEKDVLMLSREIAGTVKIFEEQLGESLVEAQSSLDKMKGQVEMRSLRLTVLKDAVQIQSRRNIEYGKKISY